MANELILSVEVNPKNLKLVRDTLEVKGYRSNSQYRKLRGGVSRHASAVSLSRRACDLV